MTLHIADKAFDAKMLAGSSCAFGVFDGLHIGHRHLIDCAARSAAESKGRCVILTFDIDPDEVFHPDGLVKLMGNDQRIEALAVTGVDDVVVLPFTPELYSLAPQTFLEATFSAGAPAHMHVGEDFRFGAQAAGTVETLREWGRRTGCEVHAHRLVSADGAPVTSTRIRKLMLSGNVQDAARLLGHHLSPSWKGTA